MNESHKHKKQIDIVNKAVHKILFNVKRTDFISELMKNLTFLDLHVMSLAWEKPDRILKEIKEHLKIPQTTLSSSVSKLEKFGLVNRVINRRDLRSYSIELTKKGREIMEEHSRVDQEQAERIMSIFEGKERDDFISLMEKIVSKL